MFSVVSVFLFTCDHVTITHDAFDLTYRNALFFLLFLCGDFSRIDFTVLSQLKMVYILIQIFLFFF